MKVKVVKQRTEYTISELEYKNFMVAKIDGDFYHLSYTKDRYAFICILQPRGYWSHQMASETLLEYLTRVLVNNKKVQEVHVFDKGEEYKTWLKGIL